MTTTTTNGGNWLTRDWLIDDWLGFSYTARTHGEIRIDIAATKTLHGQLRISLYNTTNLRILWEIASDGIVSNPFTASSNAATDKNIVNVKNDIIEKYWQSTGVSSEWIQWDAGSGETISLDTFALLGHNLTSSATLTLKGYGGGADAAPGSWAGVDVYATIEMPTDRPNDDRVIWCSPALPTAQYRHWRLEISDSTNSAGYIRVGRLVAGSALIMAGENMLDDVRYARQSYTDRTELNGYTSVATNRTLKKRLEISLQELNINNANNYLQLSRMIDYVRDTLKVLVIPDPSLPYQYSMFARLVDLPTEMHRYIDGETIYANFPLIFDEAR